MTCSISGGTLTASFIAANIGAGTYTVTASGSPGADYATANFQVLTSTAFITLNPSSSSVGSVVQVYGSGFYTSDTSCSLSGSSIASQTCSIASGTVTASFVVANVGAGTYSVAVVASPGGDSALATLTITTSTPTISLNPSSASVGSVVYVSGSGFSTLDTSCSLTGGPFTSYVCSISGGSLTATFVISTSGTGSYVVTAMGSPSNDYATAAFQLTAASPVITINPTSAQVGATVSVSGSGFSSSDSSCSLSGSPVGSSTCSISGGTLTGLIYCCEHWGWDIHNYRYRQPWSRLRNSQLSTCYLHPFHYSKSNVSSGGCHCASLRFGFPYHRYVLHDQW